MLNDRIYVNGHFRVSPSTSSSYRTSNSSSSYNATSTSTSNSSHSHSSNHSPSPLPSRRIHFSKDKSNSPSSERLNSSFNRGKDGIFRPKSLMSLATEIDYTSHRTHHSPSSSSSYSSSSAISSNPRLAQFRSHHREGSVPRQIISSSSVDTGGGYSSSSPRSRTRTLDSSFYSNFNDNLSYLSSSSSAYNRHRGATSSSSSSTVSSYLPSTSISSSPYQSYRFTTAYYAPKLRERPLLSNLRLKFAPSTSSVSSASRPSHSSINSSRTTSVSSNHSSTNGSNSVSSSETAVSNQQNNPRLERNKFLIKFREHNTNASPRSSGRRRSSISWDIPGETNFPKPSSQVAESLGETIQEVETPQPQSNAGNDESSKVLWKTAETPATRIAD
ncbi:hypothetical protein TYRP_000610 [Tyrophagus putrescentiae]|nr:hypothetical protein TYRP_000610 [Tyrophagus putrescentiae]